MAIADFFFFYKITYFLSGQCQILLDQNLRLSNLTNKSSLCRFPMKIAKLNLRCSSCYQIKILLIIFVGLVFQSDIAFGQGVTRAQLGCSDSDTLPKVINKYKTNQIWDDIGFRLAKGWISKREGCQHVEGQIVASIRPQLCPQLIFAIKESTQKISPVVKLCQLHQLRKCASGY